MHAIEFNVGVKASAMAMGVRHGGKAKFVVGKVFLDSLGKFDVVVK